jgi:hypothetical protein
MVIVSYRYEDTEQRASALFTCTDYYETFRNVNEPFGVKLLLEKIIFSTHAASFLCKNKLS